MSTSTRQCPGCGSNHSEAEKEVSLKAYHERTNLRGPECIFGVARQTISDWLKKKARAL